MNDTRWKRTLIILSVCTVLMSLSYTMLIPFLPMYLIEELGVTADRANIWSGAVFSVTFLISAVMAPIWGAIADRHSRKMMAVRAAVLLAITYTAGGFVQNEWQLLAVRCFQGVAAGLWPACLAIMTSTAPAKKLGLCLGILQGGMTAGGVLGPLLGGVLAEWLNMRATFYIGGAALALITVMLLIFIEEPPRRAEAKAAGSTDKYALLRNPVVVRMLVTAAVVQLTILVLQPVLPMYIGELQGSMDRIVLVTGVLFSVVGVSGVIASPLWGIFSEKLGYRPALYIALAGSAFFGMIQALPDTLVPFGIWRFVGGLTFSGIFPAINAVLAMSTSPEDKGKVFGLSYSAQQIGSVLGPILGGAVGMVLPLRWVVFLSGFILLPLVIWLYLARPKDVAVKKEG